MNWVMLVLWVGAQHTAVQVIEIYPDGSACNADKARQSLSFQMDNEYIGEVMCMPKSVGHGNYINLVKNPTPTKATSDAR